MDITSLLIQLIIGAVGGNAAGKAVPDKSLGTLGNTIAGAIGGLGGGQLLDMILGGGAMATDAAAALPQAGWTSARSSRMWRAAASAVRC